MSFAACLFLPWWSIAIVAFVIAVLIPQKPGITFLCAFFSLLVLWAGLSFWLSYNNNHILAHKLSLLILRMDNPFLIIFLTGIIGGLVAGFAGLAGSFVRNKPS